MNQTITQLHLSMIPAFTTLLNLCLYSAIPLIALTSGGIHISFHTKQPFSLRVQEVHGCKYHTGFMQSRHDFSSLPSGLIHRQHIWRENCLHPVPPSGPKW